MVLRKARGCPWAGAEADDRALGWASRAPQSFTQAPLLIEEDIRHALAPRGQREDSDSAYHTPHEGFLEAGEDEVLVESVGGKNTRSGAGTPS